MEEMSVDILDVPIEMEEAETFNWKKGIHPNLKQMSHSSNVMLHRCPRKYEISKLTPRVKFNGPEDDEHLEFGKLIGIGVQEVLEHGNLNKAYITMMMAWKGILDDDAGEKAKKTFWHGLYGTDKFIVVRNSVFANCELVYFEGRPATELGFSIDMGDGFTYRGFLDALLYDKLHDELVVYEGKSTTSYNVNSAMFKNSGQGLGYSLIVDTIGQALGFKKPSFKVNYCIYKTKAMEWDILPFTKSHTSRALWIKNLVDDKQDVIRRATEGYWPMRGESCFDYMRPCAFFETCEISTEFLLGEEVEVRKEEADKYRFHFDLNELIAAQLAKMEE
jgi:hypothetical protein